jgi:hypothetical protein
MFDKDEFLTYLFVMADDFCIQNGIDKNRRGNPMSLYPSEIITLALFSQWDHFQGERDFHRYACLHLRHLFPTIPTQGQFNRLVRAQREEITRFFLYLVTLLDARNGPYESLDATAVPTRDSKRRGDGWLWDLTDIGYSNRRGWFEGFKLLCATHPEGIFTGYGYGPASAKDQPLIDTFLAARHTPQPGLTSVGKPARGPYLADRGAEGKAWHEAWREFFGVEVLNPPKRNSKHPWPKTVRKWLASHRQIIETVFDKLFHTFRLENERPHAWDGFHARLAAKFAMHNFAIWMNKLCNRPNLAFAELIAW